MCRDSRPIDRIMLVPGFMSPKWMLMPLHRALKKDFPDVMIWDHPTVFRNPDRIAAALAEELDGIQQPIGIVSHSFGDWVVRNAIAQTDSKQISKFISICPVTTTVPIANFFGKASLDITPELKIMGDELLASASLAFDPLIEHLVLWARFDAFVFKQASWSRKETRHWHVLGTHNSILFQPNIWRVVRDFFRDQVA